MRLGAIGNEIGEVVLLLAIFEKHQARNSKRRHSPLEHNRHREPQKVPVDELPQELPDDCNNEQNEDVFRLQAKEAHSHPQVVLQTCHLKRHVRAPCSTRSLIATLRNSPRTMDYKEFAQ